MPVSLAPLGITTKIQTVFPYVTSTKNNNAMLHLKIVRHFVQVLELFQGHFDKVLGLHSLDNLFRSPVSCGHGWHAVQLSFERLEPRTAFAVAILVSLATWTIMYFASKASK